MKIALLQYLVGVTLGLLLMPLNLVMFEILPDIGWHFLTLLYVLTLLLQLAFYYLTTEQKVGWTIVNFALNFILWSTELVILEKNFGETEFYNNDLSAYSLPMLGGLLWTTNKLIVDFLFKQTRKIEIVKSRIELRFGKG